jgi:epoxyqueuosine reductase
LFIADKLIQDAIKSKATELGFAKTGFARAEVLENEAERLKQWLNLGYSADMTWIERGFEKRKDINLVLENAKTVISLAYIYNTPFEHDDKLPKISRYAWGKDYHKILKMKLKELSNYIQHLPILKGECPKDEGVIKTKFYVDDGPVMDKAWAVRTGIGWQGKHTNIINPELGSWFFLAEIITDLEFGIYDEPIEDMCGKCNICINACPTGALNKEYILNSNLCISYQTIENRGEIPDYINLSGWIYGCDICQDVCPYNKKDIVTNDLNFYPKEVLRTPLNPPFNKGGTERSSGGFKNKEELNDFNEDQFNSMFSDSPIKRTKYTGCKINLEKFKI